MEILGAIGGLVGAVAAVIAIFQARSIRRVAQEIEVEKILDEAWDLMGGRKGATVILSRTASAADMEEARRRIRDARRLDQSSARAARYQGVHHWLQKRLDEAKSCFQEAVELSESKRDLAASHCNLGNILAEENMLREAIDSYRKATAADPEFYLLYYNVGLAHHQLGEFEEAVGAYREAIDKNPFFPRVYHYMGRARIDMDELDKAEEPLREALKLDPEYFRSYFELGRLEERRGNTDAAIEHLNAALELSPEDPGVNEALEQLSRPTKRVETDGRAAAHTR